MVEMERYWEAAVSFEKWLDRVEENRELWAAIHRRATVADEIAAGVGGRYRLLVLAEDWCGDAVNTVPWLARLAESTDALELRLLRRDEHPELMASHKTGESLSIPVVMVLNEEYEEVGWWGPRPRELQRWVLEEGLQLSKEERYKRIRRWYARDRGRTTVDELLALLITTDAEDTAAV